MVEQRLQREMQLAHELQMKLLPPSDIVAPDARVAARVVPAESVGGDFYNLFKLPNACTGVMIGDVSGHGYQAALIMALTMSASAIHAQTTADPGETLHALFTSVRDELATTEMFISAFYGVVDRLRGELLYSNTGHPHAFVVGADGRTERLTAKEPPLGMAEERPVTGRRRWSPESDLLVLFSDGITEAENAAGRAFDEAGLEGVDAGHAEQDPEAVGRAILRAVEAYTADARLTDDLTALVVLRKA